MNRTPNITTQKNGYYISYNNVDVDRYGDVTTAIVIGEQMEKFLILNGNHKRELETLPDLESCVQYFKDRLEQHNKMSNQI